MSRTYKQIQHSICECPRHLSKAFNCLAHIPTKTFKKHISLEFINLIYYFNRIPHKLMRDLLSRNIQTNTTSAAFNGLTNIPTKHKSKVFNCLTITIQIILHINLCVICRAETYKQIHLFKYLNKCIRGI